MTSHEIQNEIEEKSLDLVAFATARDIIRRRVVEVSDSKSSITPLAGWSGTDACLGSLDLTCHAIERTIVELHLMLSQSFEKPKLQLVKESSDDNQD